jgi:predicted RNA-binding Zn-ribbon protein involved in translation (DUF1610 family)
MFFYTFNDSANNQTYDGQSGLCTVISSICAIVETHVIQGDADMTRKHRNKRCCPACGRKLPLTVYLIEAKNQFACPDCKQLLQVEHNQANLSGVWHAIRCLVMTVMLAFISWVLIRIVDMPGWFVMLLCASILLTWLFQMYTRSTRIIHWHPTCVKCDYNLQGILDSGSSHCPECGHDIQWTNEQFRNKYQEKTAPFHWKRIGVLIVFFMVLTSGLSAMNSLDRYWRIHHVGWPITYYQRSRTEIDWQRVIKDLSIPGFLANGSIGLIASILIDQIWQRRLERQTE